MTDPGLSTVCFKFKGLTKLCKEHHTIIVAFCDWCKGLPLLIQFYGAAIFQHLTEDMATQLGCRDHVSCLTGRALLSQLVEFGRQMAQHTILHVTTK